MIHRTKLVECLPEVDTLENVQRSLGAKHRSQSESVKTGASWSLRALRVITGLVKGGQPDLRFSVTTIQSKKGEKAEITINP